MKKTLTVVMMAVAAFTFAQDAKIAPATVGQTYGKALKIEQQTKARPVGDLPVLLQEKKMVDNILLTGDASAVCQAEGCWFTLVMPNKTQVLVKTKGHEFFLPKDIVGRKVLVEGKAMEKVTSVEELRHYAKDAGISAAEIEAIKQPKREYRIEASGVRVLN